MRFAIAMIVQLWNAAHRSAPLPDDPTLYPVIAVVDNRAGGQPLHQIGAEDLGQPLAA